MKDFFTDEQVEFEIERLKEDPNVKLAMAEQKAKNRRRKYMYQLRWYENRGKQLAAQGHTIESIEALYRADEGGELIE